MSLQRLLFTSSAVLAVVACNGSDLGPNISGVPGYEIASVTVSPGSVTVFIPDTIGPTDLVQLNAVVRSHGGTLMTGVLLAWTSRDTTVAAVDSNGLVTPRAPGVTTIVASATKQDSARIVVLPATNTVVVDPAIDTIFVDDPIDPSRDVAQLSATAYDQLGRPLTGVRFTWLATDAGVATVDSTGLVRAISLGSTPVHAMASGADASTSLYVLPVIASVTASSPVSQVLAGDTVQLSAQAFDYKQQPVSRNFTWSSSAPGVAQVDSSGRAIFGATGSATFTATSAFRSGTTGITAFPRQLLAVEAGQDFTCGITALGRGYCWGNDEFNKLASAPDSTCYDDGGGSAPCTLPPKRMTPPDVAFQQVSAGGDFGCGVSTDQLLYCWGNDDAGQIGNGGKGSGGTAVLATVKSHRFTVVSAGAHHACAINTTGTVYCWGLDDHGQLGDARLINSTTPIPVADTTLVFAAISAGASHTCGLLTNGQAYCWGDGTFGQLGRGTLSSSDVPVSIAGGLSFVAIGAGDNHTCAATVSGAVYCWGKNDRGQLGLGTMGTPVSAPTAVSGFGSVSAIAAGGDHTCVIASGNAVACWGASDYGEVGDGNGQPHSVLAPRVVPSFSAVVLTAGTRHTCAVSAVDQETYCWGSNLYGTLGNEYQAAVRASPQLVARPR